ncbi:MAG: anhydro-N-acetylmuramic acid kinase [Legionellaceae bacterium]|nr:anhydro-N-acetylmuramic acid kinase [Legionellaceae bacterium]
MKLYIGLMSGTSMDGIDAALVDVSNNQLIAGITRPYSKTAREHLNNILSGQFVLPHHISQLNTVLGQEFAAAVMQLVTSNSTGLSDVIAIGSHGQTICHDATAAIPYTMQLGCPHTIAELTGLTVVADFRTRDLVLKGRGAPFAPLYHQVLFSHLAKPTAVVNIGGIANITTFSPNKEAIGYDIGPGNCLMDAWTQCHLNTAYDKDGAWASTGTVIDSLLADLLSDPYFLLPSPKSIGKEYFSLAWLENQLQVAHQPEDVQATLMALTALSIANACKQNDNPVENVAICGGGAHNKALLMALKSQLPSQDVTSTRALGVDPDYIEAMMFGWLAHQALSRTPINLKKITGSLKPVILGVIYPI